jgi:hypothetical protein
MAAAIWAHSLAQIPTRGAPEQIASRGIEGQIAAVRDGQSILCSKLCPPSFRLRVGGSRSASVIYRLKAAA